AGKYRAVASSDRMARDWANCERFDETCGQLLDFLDQRGLRENTLVAYVVDNGWIQSEDKDNYAPRSKQSPNEGGLRTMIMLRLPGKIAPQMPDERVMSIDLAPTMLKLVGAQPNATMQGIDLLDAQARAARKTIYGE